MPVQLDPLIPSGSTIMATTQGSKPEEKMKVTEIAWLRKKLSKKKLRPALTKRFAQRLAKLEAIKKAIEDDQSHAS